MSISVIIPAFNEAENLNKLIPLLHKICSSLCEKYELIVVDSRKTKDSSEEICRNSGATYIRQDGYGYGDAFRCGIRASTCEAIVIVDADMSQDISKIPLMYETLLNGNDVVIGSRYVKGGKTADPIVSVMMSKFLNCIFRLVLKVREKDISTDFRFYRAELLKKIETKCENFDVIEETLFLLKLNNPELRISEIPIDYKPRAEGVSKRRLFKFVVSYLKLIVRILYLSL
jgi:dolichol-phosphate mannosyltransferase